MNIFDQYGIKEVADVTIYSIHKKEDGSGDVYYVPALYLDTLKVTTTEKTADNTWAQGGLGNSRLISWDYNKQINLTIEDAVCTPASLGLCWGGILSADWKDGRINQQYGIHDMNCGTERISRMEKAFYPRNDTVNATISNLLPRDGSEDILNDQNGDPVFLQRSSVVDGTDIRGFGYVNEHPYRWRLQIESEVLSVAVVPDRFFSIYGKSYPIKRKQTVGINQPSNSFKYEIVYLRGYDQYSDEPPRAKIIYHKQAETNMAKEYVCGEDKTALTILDDFEGYPYLKLRVCLDGSVKAYLGTKDVDWNLERQIEDGHAEIDSAWVEVPQINTEQFRNIDLWLRFDGINAMIYYLITKYENNIFTIGPKKITGGLSALGKATTTTGVSYRQAGTVYQKLNGDLPEGFTLDNYYTFDGFIDALYPDTADAAAKAQFTALFTALLNSSEQVQDLPAAAEGTTDMYMLSANTDISGRPRILTVKRTLPDDTSEIRLLEVGPGSNNENGENYAAGHDYSLEDSAGVDTSNPCVPCCKKANLSRSLWAYVNPTTMTPYEDDYWFHQGETYYKASLTISNKQAPLKAKRINITAGDFPGMYKIVGETYIRSRDTGEDQRLQLTFNSCKIKSNQTLTLQADGDPTTFNFEVEVAVPRNGVAMEMTFFEVEKDQKLGCNGTFVEKDGSTKIVAG